MPIGNCVVYEIVTSPMTLNDPNIEFKVSTSNNLRTVQNMLMHSIARQKQLEKDTITNNKEYNDMSYSQQPYVRLYHQERKAVR